MGQEKWYRASGPPIEKPGRHIQIFIFVAVLSAIGASILYSGHLQTIKELMKSWENPDNSYGYLVFPLFIYLCRELRKKFTFFILSWSYSGLFVFFLFLTAGVIGRLYAIEWMIGISLFLALVGVGLTLYGKRLRQLVFPFLVLAFMIPLSPELNRVATDFLKEIGSDIAVELMRLFAISLTREHHFIYLSSMKLEIVDACSGLRYLIPLILLSLVIARFYTDAAWKYAVLALGAIPLSVFMNAFRIFLAALLVDMGYPETAKSFFHDFSGWVIFMLASVFVYWMAVILGKKKGFEPERLMTMEDVRFNPERALGFTAAVCSGFIITGAL